MAKTNQADVFAVKPSYIERILKNTKDRSRWPWYLRQLTKDRIRTLTNVGAQVTHTTTGKANRTYHVVAVKDVSPGKRVRYLDSDGVSRTTSIAKKKERANA